MEGQNFYRAQTEIFPDLCISYANITFFLFVPKVSSKREVSLERVAMLSKPAYFLLVIFKFILEFSLLSSILNEEIFIAELL